MASRSLRARSVRLTRYCMAAPEHFQRFARRTHATLFQVFEALADAFPCISLCGDIQKALIGFGILDDRFGFPVDGENERFFRLFEMLHELRRIATECGHGLNIFFYVEHESLERQ